MAGVYGSLNSRADFQRVLAKALDFAQRRDAAFPGEPAVAAIRAQLEAMRDWTKDDRTPTDIERGRIRIGPIVVRELSDTGDAAIEQWVWQLGCLWNYFQTWPTDDEAAKSTDKEALPLLKRVRENREAARQWHDSQKKP